MNIIKKLKTICETKENVDLKNLCSIRIGGIGAIVCYPKTIKELKKLISFLIKIGKKYYLLGNGSNTIFEDGGLDDILIVTNKLCKFKVKGNAVTAECGLNLYALNFLCMEYALAGLEWSYGIPASVGGAVFMNAGAYGSEMKDVIKYVWVLSNGKVKRFKNFEMGFGYRKSRIIGTSDIILKATFVLQKGDSSQISNKQKQIFAYRKCCQPYQTKNAGSIFKKVGRESAGKTIDKLGLKSVKIGNIQISELHANFFVNLGGGTSAQLHELIDKTKAIVLEKTGKVLEEEVIFVGNRKGKI